MNIQTKITASDNGNGFSTLQYAWSTNQKIQPTTGWKNFSNGETVTLPDYTDTNYYLWINVVDKAGNIANNIRVSNAFSVYSIQLKSGPNKTEYESGENVDYTGITVVKHNDILGDEVIDDSLYTISSTRNDDIANNIRYKITVSYEGYTWNIDTYKDKWYGIVGNTWYYYQNHEKLTGMQDLSYYSIQFGKDLVNTYYFNTDGTMLTGWKLNSDETYYYFLETDEGNVDDLINLGYQRGAMIKSNWARIKSAGTSNYYWYYFNENGIMLTGWQQIGDYWYYFNNFGSMTTGWQSIGGYWYYMNSSGQMTTGWQQIGGSWYFLRQSTNQYGTGPAGSMLANTSAYINGKTYYFNASGVCTNP